MVIATRYWRLRKEHQRLAVQSGKSHCGPQTSAARSPLGAPASRAAEITTVRPEISTTGVQSFHLAGVAHHDPIGTERQHAIAAAVEKQQPFARIDGETARIGDAAVVAERAEGFAIAIKGEKRALSVAIRPGCAGNEKSHRRYVLLTSPSPPRPR